MHVSLPFSLLLSIVSQVWSINIVDFDTCSIPYIIPRNFERFCDHSDQYLSDVALTDLKGKFVTSIAPPANVTSSAIRNKPNLWTHEPFCIESPEANNGFCVYTNSRFANGRGISIVATPKEILKVTQAPIFRDLSRNLRNDAQGAARYVQQPVAGKGLGNVANATFQRAERLQTFTPTLAFQDDLMQFVAKRDVHLLQKIAVERLPAESQRNFMALMGHFGGNEHYDRISTNSFAARLGEAKDHFWAVLPETSRFNHDCRPNAVYHFNQNTLEHHVHAVRQILPGEEITISYLRPLAQYAEREERMIEQWGFKCSCTHCNLSPDMIALSDSRLNLIEELEEELVDFSHNRTANTDTAELLVELYSEERLEGASADAYTYAALEYAYIGQKRAAQKWAAKAIEALSMWRGTEHVYYQGMWRLLTNPESHDAWRYLTNGKESDSNRTFYKEVTRITLSGGD
ncbi:SET domain-containing protein [Tothia fuscella]|uniref:SET domain-containing protein n=1 Tax=Tothia fuscella TaxID=1048955 RepID=A0A9P4NIV4_9PEZI|nr:SET domain-containing protein [Tothia fuscella]